VVANHPSGFLDLAAAPRQPLAVAAWPTSPRKTRVRDFRRHASGQTSSRRRCRSIITPGSRRCGYKTVSGRHEWFNRDPIQEKAGLNFYDYVMDDPINAIDPLGLAGLPWRQGGAQQYWQTHNPPGPGLGNFGAGIGAYFGVGGEISTSVCDCCENGKEYRVVVLTSCSGIGVEGKGKIETPDLKDLIPNPSGGPSNECPKNREYLRLGGNAGPLNLEGTSGPGEGFGYDWSLSPSFGYGVNLSYCSDTVISKQPL
jgi:hypothetical protein